MLITRAKENTQGKAPQRRAGATGNLFASALGNVERQATGGSPNIPSNRSNRSNTSNGNLSSGGLKRNSSSGNVVLSRGPQNRFSNENANNSLRNSPSMVNPSSGMHGFPDDDDTFNADNQIKPKKSITILSARGSASVSQISQNNYSTQNRDNSKLITTKNRPQHSATISNSLIKQPGESGGGFNERNTSSAGQGLVLKPAKPAKSRDSQIGGSGGTDGWIGGGADVKPVHNRGNGVVI